MTSAVSTTSPAGRILALAAAEVKLLVRNRTAAISSLFLPVAFGAFFAFTFDGGAAESPGVWPVVMFGASIVLPIFPVDSWWQALVLVPGAPIGQLTQLAYVGGTWSPGLLGLPAALPALVSLVAWPVLFGVLARRNFRWDPRA